MYIDKNIYIYIYIDIYTIYVYIYMYIYVKTHIIPGMEERIDRTLAVEPIELVAERQGTIRGIQMVLHGHIVLYSWYIK